MGLNGTLTRHVGRLMAAILVLAVLVPRSEAARISWRSNLQQAVQDSGRLNRPMLLEITAGWCGYCHKMLRETFADAQVIEHVNGCFIPIQVDADKNEQLLQALGIDAFPTTVIVSPNRIVLSKITGFQKADELKQHLSRFCRHQTTETQPRAIGHHPEGAHGDIEFDGYCLVSLLDDLTLRRGSSEYTANYQEKTVSFASAEHQRRFEANPSRYWPVADGFCPVSLVDESQRCRGHPRFSIVYQERTWFFADEARRKRFYSAPNRYRFTRR